MSVCTCCSGARVHGEPGDVPEHLRVQEAAVRHGLGGDAAAQHDSLPGGGRR